MDFSRLTGSVMDTLGKSFPNIAGALALLFIGWLIALFLRAGLVKGLGYLKLSERFTSLTGSKIDIVRGFATGVFYLLMTIVLIGFFDTLRLSSVSGPLESMVDKVLSYIPNLIAGGVLLLLAWAVATVLRMILRKALAATTLDERVGAAAGITQISDSLSNVAYALVLLLFAPGILDALGMRGLLEPVQGLVDEVVLMLPNIAAAVVLAAVGWIVAQLLRSLVTNLLSSTAVDRFAERVGLRGSMPLSRLIGLIAFVFVFVPALVAALNALRIESISGPATRMLETMMGALPGVFAAAVILAVAIVLAGFVSNLAAELLGGMGFDAVPARLGLPAAAAGATGASRIAGRVVQFFIVLFGVVEACEVMRLTQMSELVDVFIQFGGQILLGVAIIGVGLWLSNLAHAAVAGMGRSNSTAIAGLVRFAILGLVLSMGLGAMGIADDIVKLAFGLTLGAVAVAFALSFGLGGREAAGRQLDLWFSRMNGPDRN